ncbi:MAG: response regulator transcription factor [Bacteroidota bacterium]
METAPYRVIIIEDEALIAAEIESHLRALGYRVVGKARNGDKALDLLASTTADIALLDISLKGSRDGIDLARIIRRKYDYPFVFITAFSDKGTLARAADTLPYGYVVKPFNRNDLFTVIELALHKYAAEQQPDFPSLTTINGCLLDQITEREYLTLKLIDQGLTYKEIGQRMQVSVNTVKYFTKEIFLKLSVGSRHEAINVVRKFQPYI